MKHYIDKYALVAEIEKWQDGIKKGIFSIPLAGRDKAFATFEYEVLGKIKDFINKLEVKEVDLEKVHYKPLDEDFERDAVSFCLDSGLNTTPHIAKIIAKHFFELGIKATQKGE